MNSVDYKVARSLHFCRFSGPPLYSPAFVQDLRFVAKFSVYLGRQTKMPIHLRRNRICNYEITVCARHPPDAVMRSLLGSSINIGTRCGENSGQAKEQAIALVCSFGGSAEGGEPSARGPGDVIPWAVSRGGSLWA